MILPAFHDNDKEKIAVSPRETDFPEGEKRRILRMKIKREWKAN